MNKDDKSDITYPIKGKLIGRCADGLIQPILKIQEQDPEFVKYEDEWYIATQFELFIPLDMTDEEIEAARERAKKWRSEH
jgi:hypothetical protein